MEDGREEYIVLKVFPSEADENHLGVTLIQSGDSVTILNEAVCAIWRRIKRVEPRKKFTSLTLHMHCKGRLCVLQTMKKKRRRDYERKNE